MFMSDPFFHAPRILVVDDDRSVVRLLTGLLETWGYRNLIATSDSSQAVKLFRDHRPDLVLLDLRMPPPDGFAVMRELTEIREENGYLPILVLTGDAREDAKIRALELGARDFLQKPLQLAEARLRIANLLETRRVHLALRAENDALEQRVRERTVSLEYARIEVLERLALTAEYRDDETHEHAARVGRAAKLLAGALGAPEGEAEMIRRAAPLHDIGKVGLPDAILLKPTCLSSDERAQMQRHVEIGVQILSGSASPLLRLSEQIARTHHERWDGTGYPRGLAGERIPLCGRIVALTDVFDVLAHRRPYKEPLAPARAVREIVALSGSHFDPRVVSAFRTLDPAALLAPVGIGDRAAHDGAQTRRRCNDEEGATMRSIVRTLTPIGSAPERY
jgi:putative two-component system response regulator